MPNTPASRRVTPCEEPAPFPAVYFESVFVVSCPPSVWPDTFAIVTAHNPDGRPSPRDANDEFDRALVEHLRHEGIESFAVVGASRDLSHREAGRGFATLDIAVAAAVSRRFRQLAFFWIEAGIIHICVDASGKAWRVGPWQERVVSAPVPMRRADERRPRPRAKRP